MLGDDLYSRQPLCEPIPGVGLNFIFVCKPSSHSTLYKWLQGVERSGGVYTHQVTRRHGKKTYTDTYRFAAQLPLRAREEALAVNWCELVTTNAEGKTIDQNAWITRHAIDQGNVAEIVQAGRARWKIENGNTTHSKPRATI